MRPESSSGEYSRPLDEFRVEAKERGRRLRRRRRLMGAGGPAVALLVVFAVVALLSGGGSHRAERLTTDRGKAGGGVSRVPGEVQTGPSLPTVGGGPHTAGRAPAPSSSHAASAKGAAATGTGSAGGATSAGSAGIGPRQILFARGGANAGNLDTVDIEAVNADGTGLRSLTGASSFQNREPAWSPDGHRVAFSSDRDNPQRTTHTHFEIYVMDADGANVARLTSSNPQGNGASSPHWSPDGRRIAFADDLPNGNSALYVLNTDGSDVFRLTSDADVAAGVQEAFPAWSPDGSRIAFIRHPAQGPTQLVVRNLDGSHAVTVGPAFGQPAWSPDGGQIAVHVEDAATKTSRIDVLAADGTGGRALVSVAEPAVATSAAWSTDGRTIAYTLDPDGFLSVDPDPMSPHASGGGQPSSIHLISTDGTHDRTLVATPPGNNDDAAAF